MSVILPFRSRHRECALSSIGIVLRDFRLGGSERVAIGLGNYWSSCGMAVILFVARCHGPLRTLVHPSVTIIDAGSADNLSDRTLAWTLAWRARQYFSRNKIDACYVPGNSHWPVVPALATLSGDKRPYILVQVSSPVCREGRSRLQQRCYNLRMRSLLRHADHITTLSTPLALQTREIVRCRTVDVVPLPALWDEDEAAPVIEDAQIVLAAGRLTPIKGFDLLIRAFHQVVQRYPTAKLVICGEGEERERLEALIGSLNLVERVTLAGYVPSIHPYLQKARVFALSSHCESFGAVLLEALAAGRQIVSTRCSPAVDALVSTPIIGRTVPPRDVPALAEALIEILGEQPPSVEELARLVKRFHVSHGGEILLSLMQPKKNCAANPDRPFDKIAPA